jgi:prevent-host-death family protein
MEHRPPKPAGTTFIPAGRFKDKSLELVRQVARTGEEIVITVRGEPQAKLVPAVRRTGNRFVGAGKQTVRIVVEAEALAALTSAAEPLAPDGGVAHAAPAQDGPRRLTGNGSTQRQLAGGSEDVHRIGTVSNAGNSEPSLGDDEVSLNGDADGDY